MFPVMKPSHRHRFLSVPTSIRLHLHWPHDHRTVRERLRALLAGGPQPPMVQDVDPGAFRAAFETLHHDPCAAAEAFRELGYDVTVDTTGTDGECSAGIRTHTGHDNDHADHITRPGAGRPENRSPEPAHG